MHEKKTTLGTKDIDVHRGEKKGKEVGIGQCASCLFFRQTKLEQNGAMLTKTFVVGFIKIVIV